MSEKTKSFAFSYLIITFGSFLFRIKGVLVLPFLTKYLGVRDYGVWSQLIITGSLLGSLSPLALTAGIVRFFPTIKAKETESRIFSGIVFITTVSSIILSLLLLIFSESIAVYFFTNSGSEPVIIRLIQMTGILIVSDTLFMLGNSYFRSKEMFTQFTILQNIQGYTEVVVICSVLLFNGTLEMAFIGLCISRSATAFLSVAMVFRRIGIRSPDWGSIKPILYFSVPLIPQPMNKFLIHSSDRFMIAYFMDVASVGIYSACYSLCEVVRFFSMPLNTILFPKMSKLWDEKDYSAFSMYLNYSIRWLVILGLPAVFGLSILSDQILTIFTSSDYLTGKSLIPAIGFSVLMYQISSSVFYVITSKLSSKLVFLFEFIGGISNVIMNLFLIPRYGLTGAAASTLVSYLIITLLVFGYARNEIESKKLFVAVIKCTVSCIAMVLILHQISDSVPFLLSVFVGAMIYFVFVVILGVLDRKERVLISEIWKKNR